MRPSIAVGRSHVRPLRPLVTHELANACAATRAQVAFVFRLCGRRFQQPDVQPVSTMSMRLTPEVSRCKRSMSETLCAMSKSIELHQLYRSGRSTAPAVPRPRTCRHRADSGSLPNALGRIFIAFRGGRSSCVETRPENRKFPDYGEPCHRRPLSCAARFDPQRDALRGKPLFSGAADARSSETYRGDDFHRIAQFDGRRFEPIRW